MPTRIQLLERVVEIDVSVDPDGLLDLLYRHLLTTRPPDARLEIDRPGGPSAAILLTGAGGPGGAGELRRALAPDADPLAEAHRLLLEQSLGRTTRAIVLHAGAVAAGDRALLILGESWAGKTTLVQALCERGFELLSDDYAPLRASDLKVLPFPRALGLRSPGVTPQQPPLRTRRWIDPRAMASLACAPLPVGAIAVLAPPGPDVPPAGLRPLSTAEALAFLVAAVRNPGEGAVGAEFNERLVALAASAPAAALARGRVSDMARAAAALL
jgi:hypothetical protein